MPDNDIVTWMYEKSDDEIVQRMRALSTEIKKHCHAYYIMASPTISDAEYNKLVSDLRSLEIARPDLALPDSPVYDPFAIPADSPNCLFCDNIPRGQGKDYCDICEKAIELLPDDSSFFLDRSRLGESMYSYDTYKPAKRPKSLPAVLFSGISIKRRHLLMRLTEMFQLRVVTRVCEGLKVMVCGDQKRSPGKSMDATDEGAVVMSEMEYLEVLSKMVDGYDIEEAMKRRMN